MVRQRFPALKPATVNQFRNQNDCGYFQSDEVPTAVCIVKARPMPPAPVASAANVRSPRVPRRLHPTCTGLIFGEQCSHKGCIELKWHIIAVQVSNRPSPATILNMQQFAYVWGLHCPMP